VVIDKTNDGRKVFAMIELLACKRGRNDEALNIELAEQLCESKDKGGIREIADGLNSKEKAVVNDCIKVLYEIGQGQPELIMDFANDFITALASKNNRLVWGSMTALAYIATIKAELIYSRLPEIIAAYKRGSVITVDNCISVFAGLCKADSEYQKEIFPILLDHLAQCPAKQIPQHAERISICIDSENKEAFLKAVGARAMELSEAQNSRIMKLVKKL